METLSTLPETIRVASPPGIGAVARRWLRVRWAEACCAVLLLVMAGTMLSLLPRKTITVDEFVHIPAGYAGLTGADFRPNNEHPPLAKLWAALPLLALGTTEPPALPAEDPGQRTITTARYFWEENAARFAAITFWARVPMIALTLALGATIFAATRHAFGPRAAVFAVALFSLEPTVLAHGRIVHTDIAAALAYLATWLALYRYLGRPTWRHAAFLGVALGAAFATKYSLLVLGPIVALAVLAFVLLAPRRGQRRGTILGHAVLVTAVTLLVINACYGFQRQPLDPLDLAWLRTEFPANAARLQALFNALAPVVPPYYLIGVSTVLGHNDTGHQAALLGDYSQNGWWYYFPVAFALKTALLFLILTVGAIGWAGWRVLARRDWRLLALLGPAALYAALAMLSRLNIGIRHFLPVFPFLFILGGVALDRLRVWALAAGTRSRGQRRPRPLPALARVRRPLGIALVALTLGWMATESARAYPDYLVYLNQLARGPGWAYLSDSNVEWGDDTEALATYLRAQGEVSVRAAVAGSRDSLAYFNVEYLDYFAPATANESSRYLAIGASFLNGSTVPLIGGEARPDYFATFRYRVPVAVFGKSIYLYRFPEPVPPLTAPLPPTAYRATLGVSRPPTTLQPGEQVAIWVQVRNDGEQVWPASDRGEIRFQVRLGDRWFSAARETLVRDDARTPLFQALSPGERTDLRLHVTAPAQPGNYLLEIDLVQEGVTWFGSQGSAPIRVPVRVK